MRLLDFILLIAGFVWVSYDVAVGFTDDQYSMWMNYSKTKLPEGDSVSRRDVVGAMRQLCLDLKDRHRVVILPSFMMLAGGLILGATRTAKVASK